MKKIIIGIFTVALLSFFSAQSTFACSCMQPESPEKSLEKAHKVFIGTVTDIKTDNKVEQMRSKLEVKIQVEKNFKWAFEHTEHLYTADNSAMCGFNFTKGEKYLVYSYQDDEGKDQVASCSRTTLFKNATEDIKALKSKEIKKYQTQAEFEKAEGKTCQNATDGCNSFFVVNGKIEGGTRMACPGEKKVWSCKYKKDMKKTYKTKEEFIKAEGKTCEIATDGVNSFFGKDFDLSTYVGYPENFVAKWSCEKEKKVFDTASMNKNTVLQIEKAVEKYHKKLKKFEVSKQKKIQKKVIEKIDAKLQKLQNHTMKIYIEYLKYLVEKN